MPLRAHGAFPATGRQQLTASPADPYNDAVLPDAPPELVAELSRRYITLYEKITGTDFQCPDLSQDAGERMRKAAQSL